MNEHFVCKIVFFLFIFSLSFTLRANNFAGNEAVVISQFEEMDSLSNSAIEYCDTTKIDIKIFQKFQESLKFEKCANLFSRSSLCGKNNFLIEVKFLDILPDGFDPKKHPEMPVIKPFVFNFGSCEFDNKVALIVNEAGIAIFSYSEDFKLLMQDYQKKALFRFNQFKKNYYSAHKPSIKNK